MLCQDLSCMDLDGMNLLMLIQSEPTNRKRRNRSRNSWMKFLADYPKAKALFIFGKHEGKRGA